MGFDELAAHVTPFAPEWAEPITRVTADAFRESAGAFARTTPACVLWGNGIDMSVNAFQTGRALLILMAITGSLDIYRGAPIPSSRLPGVTWWRRRCAITWNSPWYQISS